MEEQDELNRLSRGGPFVIASAIKGAQQDTLESMRAHPSSFLDPSVADASRALEQQRALQDAVSSQEKLNAVAASQVDRLLQSYHEKTRNSLAEIQATPVDDAGLQALEEQAKAAAKEAGRERAQINRPSSFIEIGDEHSGRIWDGTHQQDASLVAMMREF